MSFHSLDVEEMKNGECYQGINNRYVKFLGYRVYNDEGLRSVYSDNVNRVESQYSDSMDTLEESQNYDPSYDTFNIRLVIRKIQC